VPSGASSAMPTMGATGAPAGGGSMPTAGASGAPAGGGSIPAAALKACASLQPAGAPSQPAN
jgi:hypothetical protein